MTDNVLILGAGFSADAGVPLLGKFVDTMWEYAKRGKVGDRILSAAELEVLEKALAVRMELDEYHGRATFDAWNLEDILSILSFNVLGSTKSDARKLADFIKAISLTIELSCTVEHGGLNPKHEYSIGHGSYTGAGPEEYRQFWSSLIRWVSAGNEMPAILTFNYDLVLERSLHQVLIGTAYSYLNRPFTTFEIDYGLANGPSDIFELSPVNYVGAGALEFMSHGTIVKPVGQADAEHHQIFNIFKLHGSLNFTRPRSAEATDPIEFTKALPHPFIIPPLTNKSLDNKMSGVWQRALKALRQAKNVVIVGYSLPATDTHMQYFLKAALGPARDLNRIFVFDPVLYNDEARGNAMRTRYSYCFAEQLRSRINFAPEHFIDKSLLGTLRHFLAVLGDNPSSVFFAH